MKQIASRTSSVALIVAIAIFGGWLSLTLTGHRTLVVLSGSMEPTIKPGDVAIVRTIAPADAVVGDVVTFRDPTRGRQLVTHRAVHIRDMGSAYAFATKGDQNSSIEEWTVPQDGTIGRLHGRILFVGFLLNWLGGPVVRAAFIAAACVLLGLVAMGSAVRLGGPAVQRSAVLTLALVLGLFVGVRTVPTTLAAFSSNGQNGVSTFQAAASFCNAGTATVYATADAFVDEDTPGTNYGTAGDLYTRSQNPKSRRSLIRFDLPPLGACSLVSATLQLNALSASTGRVVEAFRSASAWAEGTVTWSNQPATTGSAATSATGPGLRSWNVTTQVQAMYAGVNTGFLLKDQGEGSGASEQRYASRETASMPALVVTYG